MATPYTIPQTLWESLDAVLFSKGLALARDIATELKVDPKPLIQALNGPERGKFFLVPDDEATTYQCQAHIPNGKTWMRCRSPTCGGVRFCSAHERSAPIVPSGLEEVERIVVTGEVYLKKADGAVVNREGVVVGSLTPNQKLILFEIES
jgi:hypothetical protein